METSKILTALYNIMDDIGAIKKSKTNTQQNYKFRGIDDALFNLKPLFLKHNVIFKVETVEENYSTYTTSKGGLMFRVIVKNKFTLVSTEDGSREEYVITGEGADSADKATPKAHSTAFKTWTWLAFCVPTEDAIDTEDTHHEEAVPAKPALRPMDQATFEKAITAIQEGKTTVEKVAAVYALNADQLTVLTNASKLVQA